VCLARLERALNALSTRSLCQLGYRHIEADAVAIEPVSATKFPANREINREFAQIGRVLLILTPKSRVDSIVSNQIP
jgi:hypothetical protein